MAWDLSPDTGPPRVRQRPRLARAGRRASATTERLAIASITAVAIAVRLAYGEHIRDDAYITLRYAQHVADGLGFTFDTGQRVLGTTTPLYTLFLAVLSHIGVRVDLAAVAIGITSDALAILVLWRFGRRTIGRRATAFACLFYALMSPLVAYAVSGMETPLYLLLILVTFLFAAQHRWAWTAAGCALLVLLRPDGVLVPIALGISAGWPPPSAAGLGRPRTGAASTLRSLIRVHRSFVALFLVLTVPWLLFAWRYFGSPFPQSMLAKMSLPDTPRWASVHYFIAYFVDLGERWFLPLTILALLGIALDLRARPALRPLLLWSALYTGAFLLSDKFVYPLWPFEWYFLPLLIPLTLSAGCSLARFLEAIRVPNGTPALLVVLAVLGLIHLRQQYEVLARNVAGRELLYIRMAGIVKGYGAANDLVAAAEIGALGFVHPGPLLDLAGLVSPEVVGNTTLDILEAQRPPWLVLWSTYDADNLGASSWFSQHYRVVASLKNWESRRLLLYRWYPTPQPERADGPVLGSSFALVGRSLTWQQTDQELLLHVRLTWKALRNPVNPTSFSVQLLADDGSKLAQQDNVPQEGSHPVTTWGQGDLVLDRYDLRLPVQAAAKAHALVIEGYQHGDPHDSLGWQSPGGSSLGARLYVPIPPPIGAAAAPDLAACSARFADGMDLEGFSYHLVPGGASLHLRWADQQPVSRDYTVFVHALDASGRLVGQGDAPPFQGLMPTSTWFPRDVIDDVHLMRLTGAADRLVVGLYLSGTEGRVHRLETDKGDEVSLDVASAPGCR